MSQETIPEMQTCFSFYWAKDSLGYEAHIVLSNLHVKVWIYSLNYKTNCMEVEKLVLLRGCLFQTCDSTLFLPPLGFLPFPAERGYK